MTTITSTTTNFASARSIEQMQQIAHNQIKFRIFELEERVERLRQLDSLVESVVGWDSYERAIAAVDEYGDARELTALHELGEDYEMMQAGNYF